MSLEHVFSSTNLYVKAIKVIVVKNHVHMYEVSDCYYSMQTLPPKILYLVIMYLQRRPCSKWQGTF